MRGKSVTALRTSASARFRRRSSSCAWASSRGRSISMSCQDSACVRRSPTLTDCRRPRASRRTLSTGCTMRCTAIFISLNTMPRDSTRNGMSGATTRTMARCAAVGSAVASGGASSSSTRLPTRTRPSSKCASADAARSPGRCMRRSSSATPRKKVRRKSRARLRAAFGIFRSALRTIFSISARRAAGILPSMR